MSKIIEWCVTDGRLNEKTVENWFGIDQLTETTTRGIE